MAVKPGGHVTPHEGHEIDEAILKGQLLRIVNNGFIKLESAELNPVNLNKLKSSGNYTMNYYDYGPKIAGVTRISPLNLTVTLISNELYQFARLGPYTFSRHYEAEMEAFGDWAIDQTAGAINPGPDAPPSPVDGKTLWLDSRIPSAPTLKLFINNEWVELLPATAMLASVYDPEGRKTDIYAYIDSAVKSLSDSGFTADDIKNHIEDTEAHPTVEEKAKWDNAASTQNLADAMASLRENVNTAIQTAVSGDLTKVEQLITELTALQKSVENHVADELTHPSAEKQAEWDKKVDGNHTHILDGSVVIDVDHIDGPISETLAPYNVKERVHQVSSIEEMLNLQAPAHNGDAVCMTGDSFMVVEAEFGVGDEDDSVLVFDDEDRAPYILQFLEPTVSQIWYFIIDDTKLNSMEGYLRFSSDNVTFDQLQGKPSTLGGYGITDATPKSEFDQYNQKLDELEGVDTTNLQELQRKYNRLMANRMVIDLVKTDGGVESDTGSGSTLRFELTVQNTKTLNLIDLVIPKAMRNYQLSWTSDNVSIATVSADGIVSGVAEGTCLITGYCEDFGFIVEAEIAVGAAVYSMWAIDPSGGVLVDNDLVPLAFDERSE